jgi:hypothetical protein
MDICPKHWILLQIGDLSGEPVRVSGGQVKNYKLPQALAEEKHFPAPVFPGRSFCQGEDIPVPNTIGLDMPSGTLRRPAESLELGADKLIHGRHYNTRRAVPGNMERATTFAN